MLPFLCFVLLSATLTTASASGVQQGCVAVKPDKCGTQWYNSCLKCGNASSFDCESCCPDCTQIKKSGGIKYCECSGPSPPAPSPDTWDTYEVAGMTVSSVTGGKHKPHEKAVIMLHGGGETGDMWRYQYSQGWFGNLSGLKYVFPTSAIPSHVWFITYKAPGCGLADDCAYNISSIEESASRVASLVEHEAALLGGDHSKIYLAGFSEGAQLTGYMQLAKLKVALGGTIIMDGFPLPPLFDWIGHPAVARKSASYAGPDMRWMIWHGDADPIFPCGLTISTWNGIFDALGANATLKIEHTEPGMTHTLVKPEFEQLVSFVRGAAAERLSR